MGKQLYSTEEERTEATKNSLSKYRTTNKEIINNKARSKINCEVCNCEIARSSKSRHEKLNKHKNNQKKIMFQGRATC